MSQNKQKGKQSIAFPEPPFLHGWGSVAGKMEAEGPLGHYFDYTDPDPMFAQENWEGAESTMQRLAAEIAIEKAGYKNEDIDYLLAGDLLGQLIDVAIRKHLHIAHCLSPVRKTSGFFYTSHYLAPFFFCAE